ncbi:hypothetical protein BV360_02507 [Pseudomonas syringae pv. actinidiae]|nr:hypothetical protein BV339_02374 [Pseudomonas syringae pv. actinidiae]OSN26587.1 hypothetical protein BV341_02398 [Pseudomonas syringae pv. actinidiae]OSN35171.1 hypothetical protein BV343_02297 [Pseudomonas syringae pv. actinidiae]OSN36293.1 hypothetical protein BV342_02485 [Pseudomonas syringae pv. actinidiae]OSN43700.1 hypothetical protein BV344_02300 [Pseudomonas syringae pv. actinidiae]
MASMRKIELKRIIRDSGRAEREWQLASVGRLTTDSGRRPWGTCPRRGFTSAEYLSPAVQHSRTSPLLHSFRWTVNESSDSSHTSEAAPAPLWILAEGRGSGLVREEGFTSAEYLSPAVQHSRTSPLLHSFRWTVNESSDRSRTSEAAPGPLWILAEGRGSGLVREEGFTSVEYLSPAVQHSRTSPLLHSFRWTVNESSDRSRTSEASHGPFLHVHARYWLADASRPHGVRTTGCWITPGG